MANAHVYSGLMERKKNPISHSCFSLRVIRIIDIRDVPVRYMECEINEKNGKKSTKDKLTL